jgi:hypothetical protein
MAVRPTGKGPIRTTKAKVAVVLLALLVIGIVSVGAFILLTPRSDNPGCETAQRSSSCLRVLFLGNSYTSVNDLPIMFANLAWSAGRRVETGVQAPGGWTLADQARSQDTDRLLASKPWDVVVLQEQSEIPSVDSFRQAQMYPAARQLVSEIRGAGARPIFFVTWAHSAGWPEYGMPDYFTMQASIDDGYLAIAVEQHAAVAPVGLAWMTLIRRESNPALWQSDGSHPTTRGTYLAACVFYATFYIQSPAGLGYHADLPGDDAAKLQQVAADTVLIDMTKWGLP